MSGSAFLKEDFLRETDLARRLLHDVAKDLPIIDYHGHWPLDQTRSNHGFRSITEIWLDGDHYKGRAMRANGVSERICTWDDTDSEKFEAWARTVPKTIRNSPPIPPRRRSAPGPRKRLPGALSSLDAPVRTYRRPQ